MSDHEPSPPHVEATTPAVAAVEDDDEATPKIEQSVVEEEAATVRSHEVKEDSPDKASTLAAPTLLSNTDAPDFDGASFILMASLRSQITDLTSQVNSLNTKLVTSYTKIGDLEDEVHVKATREAQLQALTVSLADEKYTWEAQIEGGSWIERNHVQVEMQNLMAKVLEETKSRESADLARTTLETEIDNLTSSLFTEANRMVAVERIARARAEEKMKSIEQSTGDMEGVLAGLLGSLREKVETLDERDKELGELRQQLEATGTTMPLQASDPLYSDGEIVTGAFSPSGLASPLMLSHHLPPLNTPRLSTSTLPYQEFIAFITHLRRLRVTILARPPLESPGLMGNYSASAGSRSSAFGTTPAGSNSRDLNINTVLPSTTQLLQPYLPLSTHLSQPFLKRCVEEDSDPALRLDLAPGLGLFSRRQVGTAIVDGTILIEPTFTGSNLPSATCCLCGVALERWWGSEIILATPKPTVNTAIKDVLKRSAWSSTLFGTRHDTPPSPTTSAAAPTPPRVPSPTLPEGSPGGGGFTLPPAPLHQQIHIFKIGDTSATRYAICPNYCLPRLRAVCDFWTFIRGMEKGLLLDDPMTTAGGFKTVTPSTLTAFQQGGGIGREGFKLESNLSTASLEQENATLEPAEATVVKGEVVEEKREAAEGEAESAEVIIPETVAEEAAAKIEETPVEVEDDDEELGMAPEESDIGESKPEEEAEKEEDIKKEPVKEEAPASPNLNRPPVPRRSDARLGASTSASGSTESVVLAAGDTAVITPTASPATARPLGHKPSPLTLTSHPARLTASSRQPSYHQGETGPIEWEIKSWIEVNRLKESIFWTRINAVDVDGVPVMNRVLRAE